jgi:hypothetical protein
MPIICKRRAKDRSKDRTDATLCVETDKRVSFLPLLIRTGVNDSVIWNGDPDAGAHPSQDVQATYSEGLYMGYKFYSGHETAAVAAAGGAKTLVKGRAPLWPFGHGLGFVEWTWNDLRVVGTVSEQSNATVHVTLSNYYGTTAARCVRHRKMP